MAIVLKDSSRCPLCKKPLDGSEEYMMIPPLTSNTKDPLFGFSDSGVHTDCINKSALGEQLFYHIDMYDKRLPPIKLKCTTDGQLIINPKDLISFGMLTSNQNESLFKFNYIVLDKSTASNWDKKDEFTSVAKQFIHDKKWASLTDFNYLEYLVSLM